MFTTEAELVAYLDKREQGKHDRVLLNPSFTGTVIGVRGQAGAYEVRVQRALDASVGSWFPVQNNGTVPVVGDRIDLRWRDQNLASATAVVGTPRVTDLHNIKARIYWGGSATLASGWVVIPYTTVAYDPSAPAAPMYNGSGITIPLSGYYLVVVKTGIGQGSAIAAGLYTNGVLTVVGTLLATNSAQFSEAIAVEATHYTKGDTLQGYIYNATAGTGLLSDATANYLSIHLLSAD